LGERVGLPKKMLNTNIPTNIGSRELRLAVSETIGVERAPGVKIEMVLCREDRSRYQVETAEEGEVRGMPKRKK